MLADARPRLRSESKVQVREQMEIWRTPQGVTLVNLSGAPAARAVEEIRRGLPRAQSRSFLALVGGAEAPELEAEFRRIAPKGQVVRAARAEDLSAQLASPLQPEDTVLFLGAPNLGLQELARELTGGMAQTRLIVDTRAVANNVASFRRLVGPRVKLMGMVKALGYGSALVELPQALPQLGLDWLGVAAPDEGVALREKGVALPLLVLLCSPEEARKIVAYRLTPALHSFELVTPLATAARAQGEILDVHLKVDTGMRRLGVMPEQISELARCVTATGWLRVTGLMTHFGCAENPAQDDLTQAQLARFRKAVAEVKSLGHTDILSHAAATGATARFPESHFDMVRIGLGLYGLHPSPAVAQAISLDLAVALVTRILEVRTYSRGDRIGYGATYEVPRDGFRAGIIPFGYHDGLPRCLSNRGFVLVNGQRVPLVGRISMDSAVLDLSAIPKAQPGAEVLIYGKRGGHELRPEEVAAQADTISYELLTRIGPRVQRVFLV